MILLLVLSGLNSGTDWGQFPDCRPLAQNSPKECTGTKSYSSKKLNVYASAGKSNINATHFTAFISPPFRMAILL